MNIAIILVILLTSSNINEYVYIISSHTNTGSVPLHALADIRIIVYLRCKPIHLCKRIEVRVSKPMSKPDNGTALTSGRLLAEGSEDLVPSQENIIVFLASVASVEGCTPQRSDIAVNGSDGEPYAGGARIKDEGNRFVLYDKNDTPLALCVHESGHAYNTYNIFGRIPNFPARDVPGAEKDGISFYPHFRIREINFGRPRLAYRSIMAWAGGRFEPMWRAYPSGKKGCVGPANKLLIQCAFGNTAVGLMRRDTIHNGWDLSIVPGVDPCLMICIAAVLKDFVDKPSVRPAGPNARLHRQSLYLKE
jgi:hypothetical protein